MSKEANNWMGCYEGGWNGLIVPEAFAHPAKFSYNLTERMIGHAIRNKWITKGSVVVDPFGGVGCGGIVAAYNDLVWIGCELEQKFVDLAGQNFEMHRRKWEKLGCPQPQIVQGDSRRLCEVLSEADIVISSPPFQQGCEGGMRASKFKNPAEFAKVQMNKGHGASFDAKMRAMQRDERLASYGITEGQLGAMPPGNVDMVVSSPPFQEGRALDDNAKHREWWAKRRKDSGRDPAAASNTADNYGQTPGNLGNLKPGEVEAIISSPPYLAASPGGDGKLSKIKRQGVKYSQYNHASMRDLKTGRYLPSDNLGMNHTANTFWSAAKIIVQQCHQILKPGGHAIWVVKAFVRKGKIVDFPGDWERLCESVGFETVCRHKAMLVKETTHNGLFEQITEKKERKSFFRRLAESKGSPRIDYEVVLCMRRANDN